MTNYIVKTIRNGVEANIPVTSVNGSRWDVSLYSSITVTLTAANWSDNEQTVTATGVTASNSVVISPDPTSIEDYTGWMVYCSAQASNSLTFTCTTEPENDITVNVLIFN